MSTSDEREMHPQRPWRNGAILEEWPVEPAKKGILSFFPAFFLSFGGDSDLFVVKSHAEQKMGKAGRSRTTLIIKDFRHFAFL